MGHCLYRRIESSGRKPYDDRKAESGRGSPELFRVFVEGPPFLGGGLEQGARKFPAGKAAT
jgi:hypothetical protein